MNVHFDNFNAEYLVSKGARDRMKKYIKAEINESEEKKPILEQLKENTNHLITNYFKADDENDLNLTYIVKKKEIHISLIKTSKKEKQKEENRKRLRNRLNNLNSKRYEGKNRKELLNKEKEVSKLLSSDSRITSEMKSAYRSAKNKFGNELPNPIEILDNKDEHIKKFMEYMSMAIKNTKSEKELLQVLDNEYSNYIGIVTGFDYKQILQMFKNNVDLEDKEPKFEELDDDNMESVDNDNMDSVDKCEEGCCKNPSFIPKDVEKELIDNSIDDENTDINSEDIIIESTEKDNK